MMNGVIRAIVAEWPVNQFFNLAFEESIYRSSVKPTIRFWRNDKVVVIGKLQSPALEVNALEALNSGVKLVRRFTGGGAVYHDLGNINFAITLPGFSLNIEESFKLVGEVVVEALKTIGVEKAYYRPLNDIEVDGLKISGLAATRSRDKLFVHGAMLVSSDLDILWRVLKISREKLIDKKFAGSRVKRVITLREILSREVKPMEVYEALLDAFARRLRLRFDWGKVSRDELITALELYDVKYSKLGWNLAYVEELKSLITNEEYEALKEIGRPDPLQDRVVSELRRCLDEGGDCM